MPATLTVPLTFDQLLVAAWQLEPAVRKALAEALTAEPASLLPEAEEEEGYEEAWRSEAERRLKDIDEGRVEMVPWEEVMAEAKRITQA